MSKPTVASLSVTVAELHREVVQLRNELAALKQSAHQTPQPKLPVRDCIEWLNKNRPSNSYTIKDMEYAFSQLSN